MPDLLFVRYAGEPLVSVYDTPADGRKKVNTVLLGTWLGVEQQQGGWLRVRTAGADGWVREEETREDLAFKVFFIDVGQGDATLIESPGRRLLVDGGPGDALYRYLTGWQYTYLLRAGQSVRLDAVVVSHFDADHYEGLIPLLEDARFQVGTLYHNGIARFHPRKDRRLPEHDSDLGTCERDGRRRTHLVTGFDTVDDARALLAAGGLGSTFGTFLDAVVLASDQGRLGSMRRLTHEDEVLDGFAEADPLTIEVLGPVCDRLPPRFRWFSDSSHTRNGHSVVLRLRFGGRSLLLAGDLNDKAEEHLLDHYAGRDGIFRVDIAKSCHHGASEFSTAFMDAVEPRATVISSGDNESYAHPRADAIGCAGRFSRDYFRDGRPLVFSTELARSVNSGGEVLYGMINLRTDGEAVVMAQMKESRDPRNVWDAYVLNAD